MVYQIMSSLKQHNLLHKYKIIKENDVENHSHSSSGKYSSVTNHHQSFFSHYYIILVQIYANITI